jgi:TRAP-type C4-dicarboxylate transport system permease small subunit
MGVLRRLANYVAAAMFAAMFFAFIAQVLFRYLLNNPLPWSQELITILWVWITFWSAAFLLHERDHIAFDLIATALPDQGRRVLALLASLLVAGAFAASIPASWKWVSFMKVETTPIIGIRYDYFASIYMVFLVAVVIASVLRVYRLLTSKWREEIEPLPLEGADHDGGAH